MPPTPTKFLKVFAKFRRPVPDQIKEGRGPRDPVATPMIRGINNSYINGKITVNYLALLGRVLVDIQAASF